MFKEENFESCLEKTMLKYYNKNFKGKLLHEALKNTLRKELFKFSQIYARFAILKIVLIVIKDVEKSNLSPKMAEILDDYIKQVSEICTQVNDILEPIIAGINVTIS